MTLAISSCRTRIDPGFLGTGRVSTTSETTLEIPPPSSLSYAVEAPTYVVGTAITENIPSSSGGAVVGYSVDPALPAGLLLDPSTGVISGTPTVTQSPAVTHTITASNSSGSISAVVTILINDVDPTISYSGSPFTYTLGLSIPALSPSASHASSFSISPALPAGLVLDSQTGVISGRATEFRLSKNYTITVTNSTGQTATAVIQVAVTLPQILAGLDFSGMNLKGADLSGRDLGGANFSGTNLSAANLGDSNTDGALFAGAVFCLTTMPSWDINNDSCSGADLSGLNLTGRDLSYVDFSNANFSNTDLSNIYAEWGYFWNANFSGANMFRATLSEASLDGANFTDTVFCVTSLNGTISNTNCSGVDLSNSDLRSYNFAGTDLSGANLSGSNLSGANLFGANLSNTNLTGVRYCVTTMVNGTKSGKDCNAVDLSGYDLSYYDFSNADLSGANLSGVNLSLANLSGANLSGADLTGARYCATILTNGTTSGTACSGVDFSGRNLSEVNFASADFTDANLRGTTLSGSSLTGARFEGADLQGANLSGATPTGLTLAGAYLCQTTMPDGTVNNAHCTTGGTPALSTNLCLEAGALDSEPLGAGTFSSPYTLCTTGQFEKFRSATDGFFVLGQDIDFESEIFTPIGHFRGSWDGRGFSVRNAVISQSGVDNVGFFKKLSGAHITNISFENLTVTGRSRVGIVAGQLNFGSLLSRVSASGSVSASGDYSGGIAGEVKYSKMKEVQSTASVSSSASVVGGLAGACSVFCKIEQAFSTGAITGSSSRGGLVGDLRLGSTISKSYSTQNSLPLTGAYQSVDPLDQWDVASRSWANESFYHSEATIGASPGAAKLEAHLKDPATFSSWSQAYWLLTPGSYPALRYFAARSLSLDTETPITPSLCRHVDAPYAGGSGTRSDPFQVATADQLDHIRCSPDGAFRLIADIDLSGYTWEPIEIFRGYFDGAGHTIAHLTIDLPDGRAVALFGTTRGAIIKGLNVTDVTILGAVNVAAIVGQAYAGSVILKSSSSGTVQNRYSTVTQYSGGGAGGILGYGTVSTIAQSFSTANVTGMHRSGVLMGSGEPLVRVYDSFSDGTISGGYFTGGFMGVSAWGSTVETSYSRSASFIGYGGGATSVFYSTPDPTVYSTWDPAIWNLPANDFPTLK